MLDLQFETLEKDKIYTWQANLGMLNLDIAELGQVLSDEEQRRAARFYFERDRQTFIVGRGILRHLLGAGLGIAPKAIQFTYSDKGKPALATSETKLHFNLAHSKDMIIWALALEQLLGVDVEYLRPLNYLGVAQGLFSDAEMQTLRNAPKEDQEAVFFHIWTQKEAILKMLGDGLSATYLPNLSVESNPSLPPALLSSQSRSVALYPLVVKSGYRACLAAEKAAQLVQKTL